MSTPDRFDWHSRYGDLLMSPSEPIFKVWDSGADLQFPKFDAVECDERAAFYSLAHNKEPNDCAVRALAVACAAPYERAYDAMEIAGRLKGRSSNTSMMMDATSMLECNMVQLLKLPGRTLRTAERALKNTHGGFILLTCNHAVGIWNGELIDHARGRLWRVDRVYRVEPRRKL